MKSNYRMLLTVIIASASVGCVHAQSVAPSTAPAAAPSDLPSPKRVESRPRSIVSTAPNAQNQYQAATDQYRTAAGQNQAALSLSQAAAGQFGSSYGFSSRSSSDSVPPVVIQFGTRDANAIGAMEEDLAI